MKNIEDTCQVKSVTCTRTGQAPDIKEKCYLSCENSTRDVRVIIRDGETKTVNPGKTYKISITEPTWEAIIPPE